MVYPVILCYILVGDKAGGGMQKIVTNSDKRGEGFKMANFPGTSFLNGL